MGEMVELFVLLCYVVLKIIYGLNGCEMDLKRDIYDCLVQWKCRNSGKVLEVSGARQVGKTYILTKSAKENYKDFLYINMMQTSG